MKIKRRQVLQAGAAAGAGAMLAGCSRVIQRYTAPAVPDSVALPKGEVAPLARLLNRVAFGPTPGELKRVATLGVTDYVLAQLHPDESEDQILTLRLHSADVAGESAYELRDLQEKEVLRQLQQRALLRAVYSRHQLRERLADFWTNHFNIYARKGMGAYFKPADEMNVVRAHALGKFPDLLKASAQSPAMLAYLDNQQNKSGVPNENYARELMELHTLGVHGGYTQKDVQEVARCFTGWTVEDRFLRRRGEFRFEPSLHDDGPKIVLGHRIPPGGGEKDAERVLDILARHPATARFICGKLCRYFLGENDPNAAAWTKRMAATYTRTGGDIPAMLRPLLLSPDLLTSPPIIKRPFDFVVSALRALNADTDGGAGVQSHLAKMGQPLYQWPMPDGYPDRTESWTGSLLARWNFALALTTGQVAGTSLDLPGLMRAADATTSTKYSAALIEIVFGQRAEDAGLVALHETLSAAPAPNEIAALLLAAPRFQWR